MEDIDHYDIPVYNFPYDVEEDDEDTIQDNSELRVCTNKLPPPLSSRITHPTLGYDALRYHWLGRGSRDQWRTGSSQDLPMGYRRGRQPEALGLPELEKGSLEVCRFNSSSERSVTIWKPAHICLISRR